MNTKMPLSNNNKPTVALLQRSIPHYRLPLFKKLNKYSIFDWIFFCDRHSSASASGLECLTYGDLVVKNVKNIHLIKSLIFQAGLEVNPHNYQVLMMDLGWTLISNLFYIYMAHKRGIKCIGWSKGISQVETKKSELRLYYERILAHQCDAIVVYGKISQKYFSETLGYPEDKLFIAQNSVDTEEIIRKRDEAKDISMRLRKELKLDSKPVVGYLGKIAPFKKVDKIVIAYEQARLMGMDAYLVIAGDGSDRQLISEQIERSNFKNDIRFVHDVPIGSELGYFQLFDLYLSFSQGGLGIIEAMAHARAILSTPESFPETEFLFDNDTAFLSKDFTVDSFAQRMLESINQSTERKRISEQAEQAVINNLSHEFMVREIDKAVRCALAT